MSPRRLLLVIAFVELAACHKVFGLERTDALQETEPTLEVVPIDAPPPCERPTNTPGLMPGFGSDIHGFSPSEDQTFALVYGQVPAANYMASTAGSFSGSMKMPTTITGTWLRIVLVPGGDRAYLTSAGGVTSVATRTGAFGDWTVPVATNLPSGIVGRPTADGTRIVLETQGGNVQEYTQSNADGTAWTAVGPLYTGGTLGHANATLNFPSLSADGHLLVYVVKSTAEHGVSMVERDAGGVFRPSGQPILINAGVGELEFPVLVGCKRVYVDHAIARTELIYQFP